MTDRPIIFNAPMVRALLAGRKTQTRRVLKGDAPECPPTCHGTMPCGICGVDPRYAPGDRLWVREAWGINDYRYGGTHPIPKQRPADLDDDHLSYLATECDAEIVSEMPYRPSIHMPRWASRLTLIVEEVRVERLQAINREDAIAEGCDSPLVGTEPPPPGPGVYLADERTSFAILWNSINGPTAWGANPWVVAVSFRVVRANIDDKGLLAGWVAP
jgi:hypothetical protein